MSGRRRRKERSRSFRIPFLADSISTADILLFPAEQIGDLVDAGALAIIANAMVLPPKPSESDLDEQSRHEPDRAAGSPEDTFQYLDIAPGYQDQVTRYGIDRFALPCGGSALVLVYRRDAFKRDANLAAARQAGLELKPPRLWTQLDALAKFFQGRDWDGDKTPDYGIALALGADTQDEGVGDATFLARAAALGQHRDQYSFLFESDSMASRIDTPPFVEALRSLVALKANGPPGMERFDAAAARASFRSGKVAMLIDRAERAATWSHGKPIDVAPVPGSDRVYEPAEGMGTSLAAERTELFASWRGLADWDQSPALWPQFDAAVDFAKYLAEPENSNRIRSEPTFPMLPVRISQMGQGLPDPTSAPDIDSRLWSDAVSRTLLAERIVPGLRIAGADDYLKDLAKGASPPPMARVRKRRSIPLPRTGQLARPLAVQSVSVGTINAVSTKSPRAPSLRNAGRNGKGLSGGRHRRIDADHERRRRDQYQGVDRSFRRPRLREARPGSRKHGAEIA